MPDIGAIFHGGNLAPVIVVCFLGTEIIICTLLETPTQAKHDLETQSMIDL